MNNNKNILNIKKMTFLFVFILFLNNVLSQKTTYSNGICEGDCENGKGTFTFNTGEQYIGKFSNGKQHDKQGEYISKNGRYKGSFENGIRQGYGEFTCENFIYKGNYSNDKYKDTQAEIEFFNDKKDRKHYKGEMDGAIHGTGTLIYIGDSIYIGSFSNGLRNGQGILKDKKGTVLKNGEWINDRFINVNKTYSPQKNLFLASVSYDDNLLLLLPKGLRKLTSKDIDCINSNGYSTNMITGYAGSAIIDSTNKVIIISHRGTELSDPRDWFADAQLGALEEPAQYKSAVFFVNCVRENYPNYEFIQTGHSLGGAIAQFIGNEYGHKTRTFDAPGVGKVQTLKNNDIINYVNHRSIIGNSPVTGKHLGTVIPIFPILPSEESSHNMGVHPRDKIYDAFNPLTGEPWTSKEIIEKAWDKNAEIEILRKKALPCPIPSRTCFYDKVKAKSYFKDDYESFEKYYETNYIQNSKP